jgi:hypothetical protein
MISSEDKAVRIFCFKNDWNSILCIYMVFVLFVHVLGQYEYELDSYPQTVGQNLRCLHEDLQYIPQVCI